MNNIQHLEIVVTIEFEYLQLSLNICNRVRILNLFFIAHLFETEIYEFLSFETASNYINFGTIQPIWEQIVTVEIK